MRFSRASGYLLVLLALVFADVLVYGQLLEPMPASLRVLRPGNSTIVLVRDRNKTVLVDAGADASILRTLGTALPEWQRHIDAVVLTSASQEDEGGLPDVLSRYRVDTLIRPEARGAKSREDAIAAAARASHTRVLVASRGMRVLLGPDASLRVLWPPPTPSALTSGYGNAAVSLESGGATAILADRLPANAKAWLTSHEPTYDDAFPVSSTTVSGTYEAMSGSFELVR